LSSHESKQIIIILSAFFMFPFFVHNAFGQC